MNRCCLDEECTPSTCMKLPEGKTCKDCLDWDICKLLFRIHKDKCNCDFFPTKFRIKHD